MTETVILEMQDYLKVFEVIVVDFDIPSVKLNSKRIVHEVQIVIDP